MEPPARRRAAGAPPRAGATASALPPTLRKVVADASGQRGSRAQIERSVGGWGNVPSQRASFPALPLTRDYLLNQYVTSHDRPAPTVPADQTLPTEPPGHRRPTP